MTSTTDYEELQQRLLREDETAPSIDRAGWVRERLEDEQTVDPEGEPEWVRTCATLGYSVDTTADLLGITVEEVDSIAATILQQLE